MKANGTKKPAGSRNRAAKSDSQATHSASTKVAPKGSTAQEEHAIGTIDGVAWKKCAKCGIHAAHGKNASRKDGLEKACKACESDRKRQMYKRRKKKFRDRPTITSTVIGRLDKGSAIEAGHILGDILRRLIEDEKI